MLKPPRGFTLVEMMIGIALLAILLSLAAPNFSLWIRNMGIRAAAESLLSGLQLARSEALKGNTAVRFQLTTSVGADCAEYEGGEGWAWVVSRDDAVTGQQCDAAASETDAPRIVQSYDGNQANGKKARIVAEENLFTFNGLGRLTSSPADILVTDAEASCASINSRNGKMRCLRIEVNAGGNIRLCDPALPATDPQGCSS
jgi:type IV fimbrial biogenesis protein FimT